MNRTQVDVLIRMAIVAASILALFFFLRWVFPLILPFFLAWIIALVINPAVGLLMRWAKLPRFLSVVIVLAIFILVVMASVSLLITQIVIEITQLINILPYYIQQVQSYISYFIAQEVVLNFINQLNEVFQNLDPSYQSRVLVTINAGLDNITNVATHLFTTLLNGLLTFFTSLPSTGILLLISVIAALFISNDWYRLKNFFLQIMPRRAANSAQLIWKYLRDALFGFVRAQAILISITGTIVIIYLMILRVDYAITLGLVMALCDLLPYLGVGTILIPWAAYAFIVGNVSFGLALAALYLVIAISRQLLEPKIVGDSVGLDPLLTLIALYVGLQLLGFMGAIIGPVAVVFLVALHRANVFRDIWNYIRDPLMK